MSCARESLVLMHESAYGTPVLTSGVVDYTATTSTFVIPLVESNSFQADFVPSIVFIPFGGGLDVHYDAVADQYGVTAQFQTLAYPSLLAFLLDAACTRINTGQTSPWTTTEPACDLASIAAYHTFKMRSGTQKRRKLTGGKIQTLTVSASRQDPRVKVSGTIVFQKETGNAAEASSDPDGTEFPLPADTNLPTGPYLFSHTSANFKRISTAVASYSSVGVTINNKLAPEWFESKFISICSALGREATMTADLLLKSSPDWRSDYQALTTRAYSLKFDNGTKSSLIDFGNSNTVTGLPYELPLGKEFMQKVTITNRWNASASTDIAITNA